MEEQPVRARTDTLADLGQHVVRADPQPFRRLYLGSGEFVPHPAENHAAIVDRPPDYPVLIRQRVAEDSALGIGPWAVDNGANRPAGTDRDGDDAGVDCIDPKIGQNAVAGTNDEAGGGGESHGAGVAWRQALQDVRRRHELRQLIWRDAGQSQRFFVPIQALQIQEAGRRGDRIVDDVLPEQLQEDVFLNGDELAGLCEQFRPFMTQPKQLGQRGHRVNRRAGAQINFVTTQLVLQLL
ncbi:hypothetical protein D3C81_1065770 [compost metagenome]